MAALLRVVEGPCQGIFLTIPNGQTVTFGRAADASYDFEDSMLSREHCAFQCKGKACRVADLKSRNGTLVNGERIDAPRVLKVGDRIKLGTIVLELMKVGILKELAGTKPGAGAIPGTTDDGEQAPLDVGGPPRTLEVATPPPSPPPPKRLSKRLSKKMQRDLARLADGPVAPATPRTPAGAAQLDPTIHVDPPGPTGMRPAPAPIVSGMSPGVAEELAAARAAIGQKLAGEAPARPTPPTMVVGPPLSAAGAPGFGATPTVPSEPTDAVERTIVVDSPAVFATPPTMPKEFTDKTAPFPFVAPAIPGLNAPEIPAAPPPPPPPPGKGRKTRQLKKLTAETAVPPPASVPAPVPVPPPAGSGCAVCRAPTAAADLRPVRGKLVCARCAERFDLNPDLLEGFKLIERLRKTRTGTVYKAEQLLLRRLVLVKTLETNGSAEDQKNLQRFMREAKTAGRLRHPGIVELFDVNDQGGHMYLVMEFVEGDTLEQILAARGAIPVGQTVRYMHQTGDALFHAHDQQIIHRDFRPGTIVIDRQSDQAKVADFSLAKTDEGTPYSVTGGGEYPVPLYMPPEQVIGGTKVDARSDIYSYGATFYHVLSGRVPLEAKKLSELVKKLKSEEPVPLIQVAPHVSKELSDLVMKAMAKDPAARFEDMTALMNDLTAIRVALGVSV